MNSNREIIELLKSNDLNDVNKAFEVIYNKYHKLVFYCINKKVKDLRDVEELTNDTFINVFNNRKKLISSKNIKYYILTISKNLVIDYHRKNKDDYIIDSNIVYSTKNYNKKYNTDYVNIQSFVEKLSLVLKKKEIEVVINHLFEGLSFKEIAKKNNERVSSVSNRYYRALEKIKEGGYYNE